MHHQLIRPTISAYLSAIEQDLRHIVSEQIFNEDNFLSFFQESRLNQLKSNGVNLRDSLEIVNNLSFAEPWEIIVANKNLVDPAVYKLVNAEIDGLPLLVQIRNAVSHSRPIESSFIEIVMSTTTNLLAETTSYFDHLKDTYTLFQYKPQAALEISVPISREEDRIINNLPIADFDETGLIGRKKEEEKILSHLKGPWPVITIIGEGAIGKTALALKVAYQVLDDAEFNFDQIVWVSAKTNKLMPTDIEELNSSIKNSWDMLDEVSQSIGSLKASEDHYEELLEYLNTFKILLIVDNLETILDKNFNDFIDKVNSRESKILITSRIGLGNSEKREPLMPLDIRDSVTLLRTLSKARAVDFLTKCSNEKLTSYCQKLLQSPGFIKWFVSLVELGVAPEKALADPKLFLDFALENVFQYLSKEAKFTIQAMCVRTGSNTFSELSFLTGFEGDTLQSILMDLSSTNLIKLNAKHTESGPIGSFEVTNLARFYVINKLPLDLENTKNIKFKISEIRKEKEYIQSQILGNRMEDPYFSNTIIYRSEEDAVVGSLLRKALRASKKGDKEVSLGLISDAKNLDSNYSEVFRVSAFIQFIFQNISAAEEDYEMALSLEPNNPRLLYWFAGFQIRGLDDTSAGLLTLIRASELDPNSIPIAIELSRAHTFLENFDASLEILNNIKNEKSLSLKQIRIINDAIVSNFARKLERMKKNNLYEDSVKLLEIACDEITDLNTLGLDKKVSDRITTLVQTSEFLFDHVNRDSEADHIRSVQNSLIDFRESISIGDTTIFSPNFQHNSETKFVDDNLVGKQFIGTVHALPPEKGFGFLFSNELPAVCLFQLFDLNVSVGQSVSFQLISGGSQPKAKIIKTLINEKRVPEVSFLITDIIKNNFLELHTENEGIRVVVVPQEFEAKSINWRKMKGEKIKADFLDVPSNIQGRPRWPVAYNFNITEDQKSKYGLAEIIDSAKLYSGVIANLNRELQRGTVLVEEFDMPLPFDRKAILKPFSALSLEIGKTVRFNLKLSSRGSAAISSLHNPEAPLPDCSRPEFRGIVKAAPSPSTAYTFGTIQDLWDVIMHKSEFEIETDWLNVQEGVQFSCSLENQEGQLYQARKIRLHK